MNIDKDIEILEKKKKALDLHIDNYYKNDCETAICRTLVKERNAIENVLKELETYKKIAKRLAKEILSIHHPMFNMVTVNNIEGLIEGARKEVEEDEEK